MADQNPNPDEYKDAATHEFGPSAKFGAKSIAQANANHAESGGYHADEQAGTPDFYAQKCQTQTNREGIDTCCQ
jgi:hypothetical protein